MATKIAIEHLLNELQVTYPVNDSANWKELALSTRDWRQLEQWSACNRRSNWSSLFKMAAYKGCVDVLCLTITVAASCHLSLHACKRLFFACGVSTDARACVISQRARWPIRTPRPTCANQAAWVVIRPKQSKANSIHTSSWHAWSRTLARSTVR